MEGEERQEEKTARSGEASECGEILLLDAASFSILQHLLPHVASWLWSVDANCLRKPPHSRERTRVCVGCVHTQTHARLCLQRQEEHMDALKTLQHIAPPRLPHRGSAF